MCSSDQTSSQKREEDPVSRARIGGAVSHGPWEPGSEQNMGLGQTDLGSNPSSATRPQCVGSLIFHPQLSRVQKGNNSLYSPGLLGGFN